MIKASKIVPAGLATSFCAAFSAGFFMACTVTPFDMIRTQVGVVARLLVGYIC